MQTSKGNSKKRARSGLDGPDRLGLRLELLELKEQALEREMLHLDSGQGAVVEIGGRKLINLSSNDYLGLASHPVMKRAQCQAALNFGAGAGASRLVTGGFSLHKTAEIELADFLGMPAARLFGCGYMANVGILSALAGKNDAIFSDELNHASIVDGCRLSRARVRVFEHNDMDHLGRLLGESGAKRKIVVVESLFSMDGDLADLPAIVEKVRKHDAFLLVDEAHALGVLGANGRGALEYFGIDTSLGDIAVVGTLGKALGGYGAFVAGPPVFVQYLVNKCRTLIFSTAPPPAIAAAARAGLLLSTKESWRRKRTLEAAGILRSCLEGLHLEVKGGPGPIMSVILGTNERALQVSKDLLEQGILARAFRPPTVPAGTSRIRMAATALLDEELVSRIKDVFNKVFD
ncbi:MAG: 8-amino-7-oxononanoate synthase [Deltaproteobacteria bacterium]|nr:8-amino-7-oxononanoate synthase [Deltaproteobacteria bacterium]